MEHTNNPPVGLVARTAFPHVPGKYRAELVRVMWMITAALALSIFLLSIPAYLVNLTRPVDWPALEHPARPMFALALVKTVLAIGGVVMCFVLAHLLYRYKRDDQMAIYASFILLIYGTTSAGPFEQLAVYDPALERVGQSMLFFSAIPWAVFFGLFPSGHFVPRWSRWLAAYSLPWAAVLTAFHPFGEHLDSPVMPALELLWIVSLGVLVVAAQIWRYRHVSSPIERQQTKWIVFGLFVYLTLFTISTIPWVYVQNQPPGSIGTEWVDWITFFLEVVWVVMLFVLPLSMTIAVLRYRLWDVNLIINRTLVYTSLTALVVGIYILIVGSLGAILQARGSLLVSLLATGIVAVLFQPLNERLQRWVNHWMYGDRNDPYVVLARLGQRLDRALVPAAVLPALVETVAHALKLPYVAIRLKHGTRFQTASEFGLAPPWMDRPGHREAGADALSLPLVYQGEHIGELVLASRSPSDPFTPTEQVLLQDIARQVGVAAHVVRLTMDLQRSRVRLVTAREEERRRLRRDLHDGLGPALAAMSFKLDATTNLIGHDPAHARTLAGELRAQVQTLLDDIRRIAYDLRPPALDELGLIGALVQHIGAQQAPGLHITLEAPDTLPQLPAAVEVAAYRITLEAINNVNRHAHARHCRVRLSLCDNLCLEIADDGCGIPAHVHAGVGLASMRERAAELGGTCVIERLPTRGTRVMVRLPMLSSAHEEEESWKPSTS